MKFQRILTNAMIEEAKNLYSNGMSIREVAEIINQQYKINVTGAAIQRRFKLCGFNKRNKSDAIKISHRKHIPREKVIELYMNGTSLRKLEKIFSSGRSTLRKVLVENGILLRDKNYCTRVANIRHIRYPFSGDRKERAYLLGVVKGDITPFKKSRYTIGLITNTTVNNFLEMFNDIFSKYGNVHIKNNKDGGKQVSVYLDIDSFEFLLLKKSGNNFISEFNDEEFIYFLSGLIDADGSIMVRKTGKYFQYIIRIYNEDIELLQTIKQKIKELGYNSHINLNGKKGDIRKGMGRVFVYTNDYFDWEISNRQDVIKLLEVIKIRHKDRISKAEKIFLIERMKLKHWDDLKSSNIIL